MTFDEEGGLLWSSKLSEKAKSILKDSGARQIRIAPPHESIWRTIAQRFRVQEAI